jgi:hypothetical protein
MSLGGLATHISTLPVWGGTILNATFVDLGRCRRTSPKRPRAPRSSRPSMKTPGRRAPAWTGRCGVSWGRWTLKRGDQEMFSMPKVAAFRTFLMYHLVHHRGQLSVYLRLNNIPVPAIYGPTADEA